MIKHLIVSYIVNDPSAILFDKIRNVSLEVSELYFSNGVTLQIEIDNLIMQHQSLCGETDEVKIISIFKL